jgi:hypothetical protein
MKPKIEVTYRFLNNWNERLQYFGNIEFDIGYPARHTISTCSNEDMQSEEDCNFTYLLLH